MGTPAASGKAGVSVSSTSNVFDNGIKRDVTFTDDYTNNSLKIDDKVTYPDGSTEVVRTTVDRDTGVQTDHQICKDPNGNIVQEGTLKTDGHGQVLDRQGDTARLEDDPNAPPFPPEKQPEPKPQPQAEEKPKSTDEDAPKDEDPEEESKCKNCSDSEPSIWHDLGVFAWGFVEGAVIGAVITAGMIGLAAIAPSVAAVVGVVLAVGSAAMIGRELGRAIAGDMSRDEMLEAAGGLLGGIAGAMSVAGVIRPKPVISDPAPPRLALPEPPPSEPPPPQSAPPGQSPPKPSSPKLPGKVPAWITPGMLSAEEEAALHNTLSHIDAGTKPSGKLGKQWGTTFENRDLDLPGPNGPSSPYEEYRVVPEPGTKGPGGRRIVVNSETGEVYYSWTHYGNLLSAHLVCDISEFPIAR